MGIWTIRTRRTKQIVLAKRAGESTRDAASEAALPSARTRRAVPSRSVSRRVASVAGLTLLGALVLTLLAGFAAMPAAFGAGDSPASAGATLADVQALFFVFASGTPAVQQVAARECISLGLSASQCSQISAATRSTWLDLSQRDPAAVGRPGATPNLNARTQALDSLNGTLASATGGHTAQLLAATTSAYGQISQPQWVQANVTHTALAAGSALVWATSYTQTSLPSGLKPKTSDYVALPDAYIKYANWGNLSSIPSIYQPYYAPSGTKTHWTVGVANASGSKSVANVLVTDVGPWNEDDNWWDANGTSTTLPASCPVSTTLVATDATSNPLVNGICPNGANLRRIYYYLLYSHNGLPFFQPSGYSPTGSFSDTGTGAGWPTALAQQCAEAAAASKNNDGITCYGGSGYNNFNAGWLRSGTYNAPVTNQSSIDLSPAMDKALGWTYPSSGLVQVSVSALP